MTLRTHTRLIAMLVPLVACGRVEGAGEPTGPLPGVTPVVVGEVLDLAPTLRGVRGESLDLEDLAGNGACVIAFLATECPLARLHLPTLAQLERRYRGRVRFLGVYPNPSERLVRIAAAGLDAGVGFPLVRDADLALSAALGVERTPMAVLLDGERRVRYRGRVDDRFGIAVRRERATREDLVHAIEEVLAGRDVSRPEAPADGCRLEPSGTSEGGEAIPFSAIAPILRRSCQPCHRPQGIAPFSLTTSAQARRHRAMMREVVLEGRMPPWHADPRHGEFANDISLSDHEVQAIVDWIDRGASPAPAPTSRGRTGDTAGEAGLFEMQDPDLVLAMPEAFEVPAEGVLDYVFLAMDPGFDGDRWVSAAEIRPGDPSVVHHALVSVVPPGMDAMDPDFRQVRSLLVTWVPGQRMKREPPDTAILVPHGSTLRWELHYTPNGRATRDRTRVALRFAPHPPRWSTRCLVVPKTDLRIPPGEPHHAETSRHRFEQAVRLVSLRPHMHRRGKAWVYRALYPSGDERVLLSVPNWDFNWQTEYFFAQPLELPAGTTIESTALWDNSQANPNNPDPRATVTYGRQTSDEMMHAWLKFYVPVDAEAP